jgi:four helix bundle protein
MSGGYRELVVWNKSMELAREVYELTSHFPKEERYGLTSQMRRAAVSIPSNIAEGSKRGTKKDFVGFLRTTLGSAAELETQLILTERLSLAQNPSYAGAHRLLDEVTRMLMTMVIRFSHDP